VIIWWCDLQLHIMTYVVVNHTTIWSRPRRPLVFQQYMTTYVIYCWNTRGRRGRDHMVVWSTTTYVIYYWNNHITTITTASCISVIYDICNCKSHHHMITTTKTPCISVIYDICSCKSHHQWSWSYGGVIYNYICHILMKYKRPSWSWSYGGVIYNYIWHIKPPYDYDHNGPLYSRNIWHM
jgi:hypothetical protein